MPTTNAKAESSSATRPAPSVTRIRTHSCAESTAILSERQLETIKNHKYSSEGASFLEPIFQPFWAGVVNFVPEYVAPNLLTVLGLACNVIPSLILFITSDGAKDECPRIVYLLSAIGLFTYQTLDAIDGKQARRTRSCSPLGELFDHGCDAISCVIIGLVALVLVQAGREPWLMFTAFFIVLTSFYFAHWQTYVTGRLRFGYLDVTEAQIALIIIGLVCTVFQNSFWNIEIGSEDLSIKFRTLFMVVLIYGCLRSALDNLAVISQGGVGIHGSSVANSSIVSPFFQFALIVVIAYTIGHKSNSFLYEKNPIVYLLTFGFVWCKYTDILIVATMSKSRIFTTDSILIGPCLLLLNQYLNYLVPEHLVLYAACLFCFADLARYNVRICKEISHSLKINCFTINPPGRN